MKVAESEDEQTLKKVEEKECKKGEISLSIQVFVSGILIGMVEKNDGGAKMIARRSRVGP